MLTEIDKIDAGVEAAIRRIEQLFPGEPLAVVSALAEGADRIVARQVLRRPHSRLVVPLPLPESEYIEDFHSPASRAEFSSFLKQAADIAVMPRAATREHAYEAAGEFVLRNSDLLIALWDGQPAQGLGGTGNMIRRARERKMPIAWVHAGNRKPGSGHPTTLDEQGSVTFENL